MTVIWFVVWLIADNVGDREPLLADPVNVWAATLIVAAALDLARQHAPVSSGPRSRAGSE